jgi:hypothetical protein
MRYLLTRVWYLYTQRTHTLADACDSSSVQAVAVQWRVTQRNGRA